MEMDKGGLWIWNPKEKNGRRKSYIQFYRNFQNEREILRLLRGFRYRG
jgi:hypothetical protein